MTTVAEALADACIAARVSSAMEAVAEDLLVDIAGICVAARGTGFMRAARAGVDEGGPCTAIGLAGSFAPADAALLNGTAAHGEDFDDTYEGGPVHAGAVVLPAVLTPTDPLCMKAVQPGSMRSFQVTVAECWLKGTVS